MIKIELDDCNGGLSSAFVFRAVTPDARGQSRMARW